VLGAHREKTDAWSFHGEPSLQVMDSANPPAQHPLPLPKDGLMFRGNASAPEQMVELGQVKSDACLLCSD
jgi:hypothetical protein